MKATNNKIKGMSTQAFAKKGYKKTKLGWIPEEWEIIKLGEVFKLSSGRTKPESIEQEPNNKNSFPVYGGNGILGYSNEYFVKGEKLIIGRVGEYCGTVIYTKDKCWITDNALYTDNFYYDGSVKFLYYLLQYIKLSRLRNKGGQPLVSQKPIYNKIIVLPSKQEGEKIAQILSTWDSAIEKTEQLIAAK